jgi:NCAIR mutase (PurE)-related protein
VSVDSLRQILEGVRSGAMEVETALEMLRDLPYEELGFAKLDHHRALRRGVPEVVFCQGKTAEQVVPIVEKLAARNRRVMATRASPEVFAAVKDAFPSARYYQPARIIAVETGTAPPAPGEDEPYVLVVSGGTSDIPVAEEAAVTAELLGSRVERLYDVGVAGLHRLLDHRQMLFEARVNVVVAGMEGALASVVGGLVANPVIAVPTSVGYGASFEGLAALLAMLNSCAPGVAVVNIDNGFGAGYLAHIINRLDDKG